MASQKQNENVVDLIKNAEAEVDQVKARIKDGGAEDYTLTSEALDAQYRRITDAAEAAISSEYRQSGSLTSARVCEINNSMDSYALTMRGVLSLLQKLENGEET